MKATTDPVKGVQRHRLQNGLTILFREDHSLPIVSTMVWYRVGSRSERPGITGISHFLEHMMFKGTGHYAKGEIDYITARYGGANNACTSQDYTAYYFSFASDHWQVALEIEADRMCNNLFVPEEFELERQVVLEELKMDCDTPWGMLRQAVESRSFQVHPYRHPVLGRREDLALVTVEQMVDYYRRYYAPNNAVLVVVGDFDGTQALDTVERLFGPLAPEQSTSDPVPAEPPKTTQNRVSLRRPTNVPRILMTFPAPSVRQPEHYAMQIVDKVLSEGKLSRFYRRLVDQERVASLASSEFAETQDPHLFFVRLELQQGVAPERAEALVLEELERLRERPLADEELDRAIRQSTFEFLSDFETTLDQCAQLGLLETLDRFEYWNTYPAQICRVTREAVMDVARRYLRPEQATVGILVNGTDEPALL